VEINLDNPKLLRSYASSLSYANGSERQGNYIMKKEIDLYLVSGFLGSGKTTFLQKLLMNLGNRKVGVIINEFGSIGIDGTLIEKDGIQLVEINNGSIYCSCIKGNFLKTLIEFSTKEIDVLIIENSGMADPSNIHQIIEEVSEHTVRSFHYKGAVCIVDGTNFQKYVKVLAPVQNQIASSNFIIINKIDLINQSDIEEIKKIIHSINPEAYLYETMYAEIPESILDEKLCDNGYIGETSNKCSNRPASYWLEAEGNYSEEQMREFMKLVPSLILRMKGFLKTESGWLKVNFIDSQVEIAQTSFTKRDIIKKTRLVVIGHDTKEFRQELEAAWKQIFHDVPDILE